MPWAAVFWAAGKGWVTWGHLMVLLLSSAEVTSYGAIIEWPFRVGVVFLSFCV